MAEKFEPSAMDPIESYDLRRRTLAAFGPSFLVLLIDRTIQVVVLVILARLLTPAETAIAAAAALVTAGINLLHSFGVNVSLVQLPGFGGRDRAMARGILVVAAVVLVSLTEISAPFIGAFFHSRAVVDALRLTVLIVLSQPFTIVAIADLSRQLKSRDTVLADLIGNVGGGAIVSVLLALAGAGWLSLVGGTMATVFLRTLVLCLFAREAPRLAFSAAKVVPFYRAGASFVLHSLCTRGEHDLPRWVVGHFLPPLDLGLFARAGSFMTYPVTLFGTLTDRVARASIAAVQHDPDRLRRGALDGFRFVALAGLPITATLFILAPDLIRGLLGQAWAEAAQPFRYLCPAIYFRLAERLNGILLGGSGRALLLGLLQLVGLAVLCLGCLAGLSGGLIGVAIATTCAAGVSYAITTLAALRHASVPPRAWVAAHARAIFCTALAVLVLAPLVHLLHRIALQPLAVLAIASLVAGGVGGTGLWLAPQLFLGTAGARALHQVLLPLFGLRSAPKP